MLRIVHESHEKIGHRDTPFTPIKAILKCHLLCSIIKLEEDGYRLQRLDFWAWLIFVVPLFPVIFAEFFRTMQPSPRRDLSHPAL